MMGRRRVLALGMSLLGIASALPAVAGEVEIVGAEAHRSGAAWRFDVTLRHADEGWEHYADQWEVLAPDGSILGTRTLYHPHVEEQPFTRSLSGVSIPESVSEVRIRARDSKHGYGSELFPLRLSPVSE